MVSRGVGAENHKHVILLGLVAVLVMGERGQGASREALAEYKYNRNTNANTIEIQIQIQIDEDVFVCRGVTYRLVVGALCWIQIQIQIQ